ncbi:hypothetical protein EK904_007527 [Melospiza melodia maxima]|nr:hypothetical protein EK904_007527 [Melospiza melodia maxima]
MLIGKPVASVRNFAGSLEHKGKALRFQPCLEAVTFAKGQKVQGNDLSWAGCSWADRPFLPYGAKGEANVQVLLCSVFTGDGFEVIMATFALRRLLIMPCPCDLSVFTILQNTLVTLKIQHYTVTFLVLVVWEQKMIFCVPTNNVCWEANVTCPHHLGSLRLREELPSAWEEMSGSAASEENRFWQRHLLRRVLHVLGIRQSKKCGSGQDSTPEGKEAERKWWWLPVVAGLGELLQPSFHKEQESWCPSQPLPSWRNPPAWGSPAPLSLQQQSLLLQVGVLVPGQRSAFPGEKINNMVSCHKYLSKLCDARKMKSVNSPLFVLAGSDVPNTQDWKPVSTHAMFGQPDAGARRRRSLRCLMRNQQALVLTLQLRAQLSHAEPPELLVVCVIFRVGQNTLPLECIYVAPKEVLPHLPTEFMLIFKQKRERREAVCTSGSGQDELNLHCNKSNNCCVTCTGQANFADLRLTPGSCTAVQTDFKKLWPEKRLPADRTVSVVHSKLKLQEAQFPSPPHPLERDSSLLMETRGPWSTGKHNTCPHCSGFGMRLAQKGCQSKASPVYQCGDWGLGGTICKETHSMQKPKGHQYCRVVLQSRAANRQVLLGSKDLRELCCKKCLVRLPGEARSAQRRQQFVFAYGCARVREGAEQAWGFPLELHPAGSESANTRQHCRPDAVCLLFMLTQHSLHFLITRGMEYSFPDYKELSLQHPFIFFFCNALMQHPKQAEQLLLFAKKGQSEGLRTLISGRSRQSVLGMTLSISLSNSFKAIAKLSYWYFLYLCGEMSPLINTVGASFLYQFLCLLSCTEYPCILPSGSPASQPFPHQLVPCRSVLGNVWPLIKHFSVISYKAGASVGEAMWREEVGKGPNAPIYMKHPIFQRNSTNPRLIPVAVILPTPH